MKWLKRKLRNWVLEAEKSSTSSLPCSPQQMVPPGGVTFRIYPAQNGQVLEFTQFDKAKHEHYNTFYIMDNGVNIGEYVSKCLSLEMLK